MSGRKRDPVWINFNESSTASGKGLKAQCKKCGKAMMGLVSRMRAHTSVCPARLEAMSGEEDEAISSGSGKSAETHYILLFFGPCLIFNIQL